MRNLSEVSITFHKSTCNLETGIPISYFEVKHTGITSAIKICALLL